MSAGRRVNTKSKDWCTPPKYVAPITAFFGGVIELDPCSNSESIVNAKIELCKGGLEYDWSTAKSVYVNPPYGRDGETTIYDWLKKCHISNTEIIALIPVATNTKHWKHFVFSSQVICFLGDTRLKFLIDGNTNNKGASMSCCLVYWGKNGKDFIHIFSDYGVCCTRVS
jgi:hypothetical protein